MACRANSGYARNCAFTIGGVQNIFLANKSDIDSFTFGGDGTITDVNWKQTAITGVTAASPAVVTAAGHGLADNDRIYIRITAGAYAGLAGEWYVDNVTANTFELVGSDTSGSGVYSATSVIESAFFEIEIDQQVASAASNLTKSNGNNFYSPTVVFPLAHVDQATYNLVDALVLGKYVALVRTNDSNTKAYGIVTGLQATAADHTTGTAFGDFAGITVTLSGAEIKQGTIYDEDSAPIRVYSN